MRETQLCLIFFFTSRRRHTTSKRDWSSDVCSSDLNDVSLCQFTIQIHHNEPRKAAFSKHLEIQGLRSEERRVGKEERYGRFGREWEKNSRGRGEVACEVNVR